MIRHLIASAAALFAFAASSLRAAEPLQPTNKWDVDYGDAHCVAIRSFGSAQKPVTLAIKPAPVGDVTQLTIVHPMSSHEVRQFRGSLSLDRAAALPITLVGRPGINTRTRVTAANLPRATYDSLRRASLVRVFADEAVDMTFALSDMAPVSKALDVCIADLQQVWHIGPSAASLRRAASPIQPLNNLMNSDDYPGVAAHEHGSGGVGVMLLVDEMGRIASCDVTDTSGIASLDAQTCYLLARRARFNPAIGADGKPTKSGFAQRVLWKLR